MSDTTPVPAPPTPTPTPQPTPAPVPSRRFSLVEGWVGAAAAALVAVLLTVGVIKFWPKPAPDVAHELSVPAVVKMTAPGVEPIVVKTDARRLHWISTSRGIRVITGETGRSPWLFATTAGEYRIAVYRDDGFPPDGPILIDVVVAGPQPPAPPGPGPGPGPTPPGPAPDAELARMISEGYAKDTDADKPAMKDKLASVYRVGASVIPADTSLTTVKEVDAKFREAAQNLIGTVAIPNTRDAVGKWLRMQLPTRSSTPLDDALRAKMKDVYGKIAPALDAVKGG